eukprot:6019006-Prymnesium_polylepis.1
MYTMCWYIGRRDRRCGARARAPPRCRRTRPHAHPHAGARAIQLYTSRGSRSVRAVPARARVMDGWRVE